MKESAEKHLSTARAIRQAASELGDLLQDAKERGLEVWITLESIENDTETIRTLKHVSYISVPLIYHLKKL